MDQSVACKGPFLPSQGGSLLLCLVCFQIRKVPSCRCQAGAGWGQGLSAFCWQSTELISALQHPATFCLVRDVRPFGIPHRRPWREVCESLPWGPRASVSGLLTCPRCTGRPNSPWTLGTNCLCMLMHLSLITENVIDFSSRKKVSVAASRTLTGSLGHPPHRPVEWTEEGGR